MRSNFHKEKTDVVAFQKPAPAQTIGAPGQPPLPPVRIDPHEGDVVPIGTSLNRNIHGEGGGRGVGEVDVHRIRAIAAQNAPVKIRSTSISAARAASRTMIHPTFGPSGAVFIDGGFGSHNHVHVFGNYPVVVENAGP
jgi:hypothetical protein